MCAIRRILAVVVTVLVTSAAAVSCELPAGSILWVRLVTPVSSYYSKTGDAVKAILTEDLVCKSQGVVLPAGTQVTGSVTAVKKVGWGIRHETASLALGFNLMEGSTPIEFKSRVIEVENSRETVKNGVILGIRSTDTPQGTINSRLKHLPTWNPYTDAFLIAYKATFPIFPEPEIWYGPGTDLQLALTEPLTVDGDEAAGGNLRSSDGALGNSLALQFPERVFTLDEKEADVVNLAFVGTKEEMQSAFVAAGWVGSDKLSKSSFLHVFHAFLNNSGYATAPMRPMMLGNDLPQMTWQKSLNTYSKRDHLRVWQSQATVEGETVWVGAATHDDGATLSLRQKRFIHRIDPQIDKERTKVVRDLAVAGCVQSVRLTDRPDLAHYLRNATGDPVTTDGKLAVVRLKDCSTPQPATAANGGFKPGNVVFRYLRRQVLTIRSDVWRANMIYGAYDLARLLGRTARSVEKPHAVSAKLTNEESTVVSSGWEYQAIAPENDDSYCGWQVNGTPYMP